MAQQEAIKSSLTIKTLCVSPQPGISELFLREGDKYVEVELPLNNLSVDYKANIADDGTLRFYVQEAGPKEGETVYREIAAAKVPPGTSGKMIALFIPTVDKAKPFACMLVSLDSKFNGGDRLMFNLSDTNIAGTYTGKKFTVPKNGRYTLSPSSQGNGDPLPIVLYYQTLDADKKWKPFLSGMWINDSENRTLLFFFKQNNGNITFRGVPMRIVND